MDRLEAQLNEDLKTSLKSGDTLRRSVIQMIRSLVLLEKKKGSAAEKLREALEQALGAGREDLVERTRREIEIAEGYLPAQLGEEELRRLVDEVVAGTAERGPKAMGMVMKEVLGRAEGRADGKAVQAAVRRALGL